MLRSTASKLFRTCTSMLGTTSDNASAALLSFRSCAAYGQNKRTVIFLPNRIECTTRFLNVSLHTSHIAKAISNPKKFSEARNRITSGARAISELWASSPRKSLSTMPSSQIHLRHEQARYDCKRNIFDDLIEHSKEIYPAPCELRSFEMKCHRHYGIGYRCASIRLSVNCLLETTGILLGIFHSFYEIC